MDFINELSLLYRFITKPIATVATESPRLSLVLMVCALYTLSLYSSSSWGFGFLGYVAITILGLVIGLGTGVIIDTVAQLLYRCQPQGLRIGYWLIIAQLPGLLGFPIEQIGAILQTPNLIWAAHAGVSILVLCLEFHIIKTIYNISNLQSVSLLIAIPITLGGIALLFVLSGATYLMHLG
jgi:hypothetical protein